jgi:hypothetical protein
LKTKLRKALILSIFAWYATLRFDEPALPGVQATMVIGPFATERVCLDYMEQLRPMAEFLDGKLACLERRDA